MDNSLRHLAEFEDILKSYQISEDSKKELMKTRLVLLTAPTSAGRNTIIKKLVQSGKYQFVVSDTTRNPRTNDGLVEQSGNEYWFKSEKEVLDCLKKGGYIGASIIHRQQVSGISIEEIKRIARKNKIAVTDMETQGVDSMTKIKPDTIAIFVLPPSFEEWMKRIKHRGYMSDEEFKRRLKSARDEFLYAVESNKFIFVINDDLNMVVKQIDQFMDFKKTDMADQQECRELALDLSQKTEKLF